MVITIKYQTKLKAIKSYQLNLTIHSQSDGTIPDNWLPNYAFSIEFFKKLNINDKISYFSMSYYFINKQLLSV